ncbi:MAG TPA: agmatinase family protein [Fimbriimonadaceae bacterium]|nr:agmatinase family protein [Fimbriimonadaceae bacterium]
MSSYEDSRWPRAGAWLAGDHVKGPKCKIAVLGAPLNKSITPGRCDLAPAAVRSAMSRLSTYDATHDVDVRKVQANDLGDLNISKSSPEEAFEQIRDGVKAALKSNNAAVVLGGDNGVTRGGVHGLGVPLDKCGLVTLDAHLDLRETSVGLMNGNPVRALLEDGLPGGNIVQIGIAPFANSAEYMKVARDAGIEVVMIDKVREAGIEQALTDALDRLNYRTEAIYFDLDVDCLDRAFAPACPGARPGGLSPHEAMTAAWIAGRHPKVRVMDLVEIDPEKDANDVTCLAAGLFLLSLASGMVERLS